MKSKQSIFFVLIFCLFSFELQAKQWSFVVMSDIHIYASGKIPQKLHVMVDEIIKKKPEIVFITGDHTSGNTGDQYSLEHIKMWYDQLDSALKPIYDAGIIVIPTVGNHDFYLENHKLTYSEWAEKTLAKHNQILNIDLSNPLYFKLKYRDQEFFIMKFWTFSFDRDQKKWFESNTQQNPEFYRFAFGHVPLQSIRGRTSESFYTSVMNSFTKGKVEIYFSGHEHMHWDEFLRSKDSPDEVRQLTVGTSSGTYNHPIRQAALDVHCKDKTMCTMPATKRDFYIETRKEKAGYQVNRQNFVEVIFQDNMNYKINSYSIDQDLKLIDFYID